MDVAMEDTVATSVPQPSPAPKKRKKPAPEEPAPPSTERAAPTAAAPPTVREEVPPVVRSVSPPRRGAPAPLPAAITQNPPASVPVASTPAPVAPQPAAVRRIKFRIFPPMPRTTIVRPSSRLPEPNELEASRLPQEVYERLRTALHNTSSWRVVDDRRVCNICIGAIVTSPDQAEYVVNAIPAAYTVEVSDSGDLRVSYPVRRFDFALSY